MKKIHLETIGSTNSYLKERHRGMVDFSFVWADRQTEGRGRLGRTWVDDGKSALFSILLKENLDSRTIDRISLVAAEAVHRVLFPSLPELRIKWPNDLWVGERKLAGILAEAVFEDGVPSALVVGIGINANQTAFPDGMRTVPTSLLLETGRIWDIESLANEVGEAFRAAVLRFRAGDQGYLDYGNAHSALAGKPVRFLLDGSEKTGVAGLMGPDGSLKVETPQGTLFLRSGEVSFLR